MVCVASLPCFYSLQDSLFFFLFQVMKCSWCSYIGFAVNSIARLHWDKLLIYLSYSHQLSALLHLEFFSKILCLTAYWICWNLGFFLCPAVHSGSLRPWNSQWLVLHPLFQQIKQTQRMSNFHLINRPPPELRWMDRIIWKLLSSLLCLICR